MKKKHFIWIITLALFVGCIACDSSIPYVPKTAMNNYVRFNDSTPINELFFILEYGGRTGNAYFQTLTLVGGATVQNYNAGFATSHESILVSINLYTATQRNLGAGVYNVSKIMTAGTIPYIQSIFYPYGTLSGTRTVTSYSSGSLMVTNLDGYYTLVGNFQNSEGDTLAFQYNGEFYTQNYFNAPNMLQE